MKIYGTMNQMDSDKKYILQELITLKELKENSKDFHMEIYSYDAKDSDYGIVEQVGNRELEFYKCDLDEMEEIKQ